MTLIEKYRQSRTGVKSQSPPQFTPAADRVGEGRVGIGAVTIASTTIDAKYLPASKPGVGKLQRMPIFINSFIGTQPHSFMYCL